MLSTKIAVGVLLLAHTNAQTRFVFRNVITTHVHANHADELCTYICAEKYH